MSGSEFDATSVFVLPLTLSSLSWISSTFTPGWSFSYSLARFTKYGDSCCRPNLVSTRQRAVVVDLGVRDRPSTTLRVAAVAG